MKRKDFIAKCGFACAGILTGGLLLESCATTKSINAAISGSDMLIPLSDFEIKGKGDAKFYQYIIAQNAALQYPICVFRHNASEYSAVLMKCTHQGAELQVFGDKLQCPAHGSEFDSKGAVQNGPADTALRSFPITMDNNNLIISLKV
jgi:Rieske Fe-S protein